MEVAFLSILVSLANECIVPYHFQGDTNCLAHAPCKCMYAIMHPLRDPRRIRGIYRINGGYSMYICWYMHACLNVCMYVCMDILTSDTCFSKGVLTISTESDEIASMPEYKVRKQVSIMYVRMYVWRWYINVFVSCHYDSMYVCM